MVTASLSGLTVTLTAVTLAGAWAMVTVWSISTLRRSCRATLFSLPGVSVVWVEAVISSPCDLPSFRVMAVAGVASAAAGRV